MPSYLLGFFNGSPVLKIDRDPGCSERVAACRVRQSCCFDPSLDHPQRV